MVLPQAKVKWPVMWKVPSALHLPHNRSLAYMEGAAPMATALFPKDVIAAELYLTSLCNNFFFTHFHPRTRYPSIIRAQFQYCSALAFSSSSFSQTDHFTSRFPQTKSIWPITTRTSRRRPVLQRHPSPLRDLRIPSIDRRANLIN